MGEERDFFNYYSLEEEIGTGACSTVYQCRHRSSGNRFAAKVCDRSNSNYVTLLQREALLLSKLNNKNVIKCEGIYSDERDQVYTVLELVDGGELNEVVNEFGAFSERDGQAIAFQLCQAIECLHSVNMIHRDIKPENILVTEKGVVKLADFGLATQTHPDDPTAVGCVGTHSFQAPEILMGVPYTSSVDMWAFGVTIYILLSAKKPFPKVGQNKAMQRCKILNGEYDFFWRSLATYI
jgi:serine/threonine protein kinase